MFLILFVKASTEPNPDGTADEESPEIEQSTENSKQQKSTEPKQVGG